MVAIDDGFAITWKDGTDIRTAHYDLNGNQQQSLLIDSSGNDPLIINADSISDSLTIYRGTGSTAIAPPDILASRFSEAIDEVDAAVTAEAELILGNVENGIAVLRRVGDVQTIIKLTAPNLTARSIDATAQTVLVLTDDAVTGKPQVYEYTNGQLIHRATINVVGSGTSINALQQGWGDRKSTRLNSSHIPLSRMPSSA